MAVISGLTVANCYYNQPLLEMIRHDLGISQHSANLITVATQIGYALGLCFLIPMGDLYSRRRIIVTNMTVAAIMAIIIALAHNVWLLWGASLFLGACSVIPQFFIPIAGQYSAPKNKSRNMGIVLSGLLTGILASRVISGYVGDWLGWREMFLIAAVVMLICMALTLKIIPEMKRNYIGSYKGLMVTVFEIFAYHPRIRLYSIRAAFGFGSMMAIWSCLAFHLAQAPFFSGSEMVGTLGACGIAGALAASGIGKLVPRYGIRKLSLYGAVRMEYCQSLRRYIRRSHHRHYSGRHRSAMSATQQSEWLHPGNPRSSQQSQHHLHDHLFHWWIIRNLLCRHCLDPDRMAGSLYSRNGLCHHLALHLRLQQKIKKCNSR